MEHPGSPKPELLRIAGTDLLIACILTLLTLALHSWHILGITNLAGQFSKYPLAANQLLLDSLPADRLFDFSPAYLWLCALIAKVSSQPYQLLQWTQLTLVALTAAALYLLLRSYFSRLLALSGVVAFIFNASVIIYSYIFEPEPVLMFLLMASLLMARYRNNLCSAFVGCTVLLCILTRPVHILLVAAIPLYKYLQQQRRLVVYASFLLPVAVGIMIFMIYSWNQVQTFTPPIMNPGVVFYEGNSPLASGTGVVYPPLIGALGEDFPAESDYQHALYRLVARRDAGTALTPREVNGYWSAKAINFILDEPLQTLTLLAKKAFYIFHSYRWADIRSAFDIDLSLQASRFPLLPLAPLSALALCGICLGLRRWREYVLLYTVFISQVGVMLLTYASDRQRVGLIPLIIFFAIVAITELWRFRSRSWIAFILLIPLTLALAHKTESMQDNDRKWTDNYNMLVALHDAKSARDDLQLEKAKKLTARAWATAPWVFTGDAKLALIPATPLQLTQMALNEQHGDNPTASYNRALLLIRAGRLPEAEKLLLDIQQGEHDFVRALNRVTTPAFYLGKVAALRGDKTKAVIEYTEALKQVPGDPFVLARLAVLSDNHLYAEQLERYFGRPEFLVQMGRAALELGFPQQAAEYLQGARQLLPEYWEGQMLLAAALADAGKDREAVDNFLQGMRKRSEPLMFQDKILPALRRWAEASAPEDNPHYWYGHALIQYGSFEEARKILEDSFTASGRHEVAEELARLDRIIRQNR